MRKLYEIRADIQEALNPRISEDDALNDEMENPATPEQIRDNLTALGLEFDEKLENCLAYCKNLKAEEDAIADEIRRLTARKKALQNKQASIKEYTLAEIEATERMGITAGIHKGTIAKSRDAVVVLDEHAVPDRFVEIITKVDKREILDWYKRTGEIVAGTEIETDRRHLRVS